MRAKESRNNDRIIRKNASAFASVVTIIEQRWGKQVVHQNLLVAKVRDLSLKVAIQKAFADSGEEVCSLARSEVI